MAQPDKLNTTPKIAALLESLVQRQDQPTPITCYLCEQVFLDTKTLVNHFKSHSFLNGSVNPNSLVQIFATPGNQIRNNTNNSHSSSASLNTHENVANENLRSNARQTIASNPSKLPLNDSLVSAPSKKPTELIFKYHSYSSPSISRSAMNHRVLGLPSNEKQKFTSAIGPKISAISNSKIMEGSKLPLGDSLVSPPSKKPAELIFRHQPYPYPSISHSAMNHGVWGSRSNKQHNFSPPFWPNTSAIINSKIMEGSNFRFPTKQSSFSSLVTVGKPSQSVECTSGLGPTVLSTKLYINQLERPVEEMTVDGDTDGDELDLTLKL